MQPIQVGSPGQLVAVDILGPFPEFHSGKKYILVVVDNFTMWSEAYAIPNREAVTVAHKLTQEWFFCFSPSESLLSDPREETPTKKWGGWGGLTPEAHTLIICMKYAYVYSTRSFIV